MRSHLASYPGVHGEEFPPQTPGYEARFGCILIKKGRVERLTFAWLWSVEAENFLVHVDSSANLVPDPERWLRHFSHKHCRCSKLKNTLELTRNSWSSCMTHR